MTGTGWTLQQLEATPWPDVLELLAYWREWPPVHVLVKTGFFTDSKAKGGPAIRPTSEEQLRQILAESGL